MKCHCHEYIVTILKDKKTSFPFIPFRASLSSSKSNFESITSQYWDELPIMEQLLMHFWVKN